MPCIIDVFGPHINGQSMDRNCCAIVKLQHGRPLERMR